MADPNQPGRDEAPALPRSEDTYRSIFDGAHDAIAVIEIETGAILDVNRAFCRMTGLTPDEARSTTIGAMSEPLPEYSDTRALELIRQADRAGGAPVFTEWRARSAAGGFVTVEASLHKARVAGKDRVLAFARDITQRRQREEQLGLRQRMNSLGTLAAGFAHDFNNLLQAIALNISLLERSPELSPRDRELVAESLHGCARAAEVIRRLREIAAESVDEPLGTDPFDIAGEVLAALGDEHPEVDCAVDFEPGAHRVRLAAAELHQILFNLVANAMQAITDLPVGAEPGEVRVSATRQAIGPDTLLPLTPGDYVRIRVRDTGPGMTAEVRRRAFDLMFTTRGRTSRGGQGLGLAMVYRIAERCGGHARIASAAGEPTAVDVYLPEAPAGTARSGE